MRQAVSFVSEILSAAYGPFKRIPEAEAPNIRNGNLRVESEAHVPRNANGVLFAMGGYAAYVWPSYTLAFIILVGNIIAPMQQRKKIVSDIARKIRRARNEQK